MVFKLREKGKDEPSPVPVSGVRENGPRGRAFFTAADLAHRWDVSERHVRRLIDTQELVSHKFGRAVRISLANALVYEASRTNVT